MSSRTRKLVGTVIMTLFLTAYAFIAMLVAVYLQVHGNKFAEVLYYFVAGLAWVVPAGVIIWWMQKPDPEPNAQSNHGPNPAQRSR